VAVTVEGLPSVVLDDEFRVVGVNDAAAPWFGRYVGEVVFESYAGAEPLFRPYFETALRTRRVVEFVQFYDGTAAHLTVLPGPGKLTVTWKTIGVLDTFTLEGLRASLAKLVSGLESAEDVLDRSRVRDSLRVVTGGA
jgi:hypothetical protein